MKRFLIIVCSIIIAPLVILLIVYFVTDPFKTLKPFSLEYFDTTNRDYLSSELYLLNSKTITYDSFIFGSSRCCGINSYHWKHYLPEGSNQFVFQAWAETITGIYQKIKYLDETGSQIHNVLIFLDIPGSFSAQQLPTSTLSIKDWKISGQSFVSFQSRLIFNYFQKPSIWGKSIRNWLADNIATPTFDTISNDWDNTNILRKLSEIPERDSLCYCSNLSRNIMLKRLKDNNEVKQMVSNQLIDSEFEDILRKIKIIFDKNKTDYKIVISPAIWQLNPSINPLDFCKLCCIFGKENIYDFSGINEITDDYNNFSDPNHFGLRAGWLIIEKIYGYI